MSVNMVWHGYGRQQTCVTLGRNITLNISIFEFYNLSLLSCHSIHLCSSLTDHIKYLNREPIPRWDMSEDSTEIRMIKKSTRSPAGSTKTERNQVVGFVEKSEAVDNI